MQNTVENAEKWLIAFAIPETDTCSLTRRHIAQLLYDYAREVGVGVIEPPTLGEIQDIWDRGPSSPDWNTSRWSIPTWKETIREFFHRRNASLLPKPDPRREAIRR